MRQFLPLQTTNLQALDNFLEMSKTNFNTINNENNMLLTFLIGPYCEAPFPTKPHNSIFLNLICSLIKFSPIEGVKFKVGIPVMLSPNKV